MIARNTDSAAKLIYMNILRKHMDHQEFFSSTAHFSMDVWQVHFTRLKCKHMQDLISHFIEVLFTTIKLILVENV